jgi:hypothetical protein
MESALHLQSGCSCVWFINVSLAFCYHYNTVEEGSDARPAHVPVRPLKQGQIGVRILTIYSDRPGVERGCILRCGGDLQGRGAACGPAIRRELAEGH